MKTRTGSGMDKEWGEDSYLKDEPVYEREDASVSPEPDGATAPVDDEKSDPFTDGLDDDPIDEIEEDFSLEENEEDEEELQEQNEAQQETGNATGSEEPHSEQDEMPLFEKYFIDDSSVRQKPLDLTDSHDTLGERLIKYRRAAGLSHDQVFAKTRIVQDYLANLEMGRYSELTGRIYAQRHIATLCKCYGLDDSIMEELHELLVREYEESGCAGNDVVLPNSGVGSSVSENRHSSLLANLPKIVIMFLLIALIVMIVLAMIVPLLSKSRKHVVRPVDMAPLVVPSEGRPHVFGVPK